MVLTEMADIRLVSKQESYNITNLLKENDDRILIRVDDEMKWLTRAYIPKNGWQFANHHRSLKKEALQL